MNFSENLQNLRKAAGMSQEELAERLGVSRQAVSKWETDGGYPEMDKLLLLRDLFGVTVDELMMGRVEVDRANIRKKYHRLYTGFAKGIATGVALIIAGTSADMGEAFGPVIFLMFAAVGVALLTLFGVKKKNFEREHPYMPEIYSPEERESFTSRKMPYLIAGGVALIFIGVIITTLNVPYIARFSSSLMLLLIAAAVWLFIYAGLRCGMYDIKSYNIERDYEQGIKPDDTPEAVARKKRRYLGRNICGVIMLAATAFYLFMGFVASNWDPSWVVFPICGILCFAVMLVCKKGGNR